MGEHRTLQLMMQLKSRREGGAARGCQAPRLAPGLCNRLQVCRGGAKPVIPREGLSRSGGGVASPPLVGSIAISVSFSVPPGRSLSICPDRQPLPPPPRPLLSAAVGPPGALPVVT